MTDRLHFEDFKVGDEAVYGPRHVTREEIVAFAAEFVGSLPDIVPFDQLAAPVNGIVPLGNGYILVATDGGVFNFSDTAFAGSLAGNADSPVVGIAGAG